MEYKNRSKVLSNPLVKAAVRITIEEFQTFMSKEREKFEKIAHPMDTEGLVCKFDNPYTNRSGVPLCMDWIYPENAGIKETPVVVIVHGGMLIMADRSTSRRLGAAIAKRGYLVAIIDYRLVPSTDICGQFDDICAGLDYVGQSLIKYDVDFNRMYLLAESAGAFLATYVAAMQGSKRLQNAIGHKPSKFRFKAMGLISGMFYTAEDDLLGKIMADQFYGNKIKDDSFMQYMNPNHPEIMNQMPPTFLITSKGDLLNGYTLSFHDHLKQFNKDCHLLYYGNPNLMHSFLTFVPDCPEGVDALDKMLAWFEKKAEEADRRIHLTPREKAKKDKVDKRMEDRSITKQKMWKIIEETNSISEERLNNIAVIDGQRTYTYRQMFREWGRFAEIFTALGIGGKNHSRVAITSAISTEIIFATYALNIIGASASIITDADTMMPKRFREMIRQEHITDLILIDFCVTPTFVKNLINEKDQLGLNNIIVIHSEVTGPCTSKTMRESANWIYKELRNIPGVVFLRDLFHKYETTPYTPAKNVDNESAIIFHTSGTTKGIHKPIPMSDQAMNEAAIRMHDIPQIKSFVGKARILISVDPANAYGMVNQIHMPLVLGCTLIVVPMGANTLSFCRAITYYKADIVYTSASYIEVWAGAVATGTLEVDFSSIKMMVIGGSYISEATRKRYNDFLQANGSPVKVTNGYGLSECGGACILADPEAVGDEIGYPIPEVNVLVKDSEDDSYYETSAGERTGMLYINSKSLSSGTIDGEIFFEPEIIDGKPYICTYDQVHVNENGSLTYLGRADRFYINNEGVRFDAGLVETLMTKQEGIKECALIPLYDKVLHDTQPGLVVTLADPSKAPDAVIKEALVNEFIRNEHIRETNMPVTCTVVPVLPHNATGKIDIHGLTSGEVQGLHFSITPLRVEDKLIDIKLDPIPSVIWQYAAPEGLEEEGELYAQSGAIIMMLAGIADDLVVFPFFGYWPNFIKNETPEIYKKLASFDMASIMQMAQSGDRMNMQSIVAGLQPQLIKLFTNLSGKEKTEMQKLMDLFSVAGNNPGLGAGSMPGMQGYGQGSAQPGGQVPPMQGYGMPSMQGYGKPSMQGYGMPSTQGYGMPQMPAMGMPSMQGYNMPQMPGIGLAQMQGYGMPQIPGLGLAQMQGYGMTQMPGAGMPFMQGYGQNPAPEAPQPQEGGMPLIKGYGQNPMPGAVPPQDQAAPAPQGYGTNPAQAAQAPEAAAAEAPAQDAPASETSDEGEEAPAEADQQPVVNMQGYGAVPSNYVQSYSPELQNVNNIMGNMFKASDTSHNYESD